MVVSLIIKLFEGTYELFLLEDFFNRYIHQIIGGMEHPILLRGDLKNILNPDRSENFDEGNSVQLQSRAQSVPKFFQ